MTKFTIHGEQVDTVFELLGSNENAMTYSLGWALYKCEFFRQSLAHLLGINEGFSESLHIRLQEFGVDKGYTDIELVDPERCHIIIEAKRGFDIPSKQQLERYASRLNKSEYIDAQKLLVVLAEADRDETWLRPPRVPEIIDNVKVKSISWRRFEGMADGSIASASNTEKRLLRQLVNYLKKVTTMQNQQSNLVYVVALGKDFSDIPLSPIDVVEKYKKYFHPVGNRWPIEPPNYIAFRYNGRLQSIHHIESYKVIEDYQEDFNLPSPCSAGSKHYLYDLGPAINPPKEVRTIDKKGGYTQIQRSNRCECFLDLLLTCDSVSEAHYKTKERLNYL